MRSMGKSLTHKRAITLTRLSSAYTVCSYACFCSSPRLIEWVKAYHAFAVGEYKRGAVYDDQALFNR